ncbi:MAG: hypothetical protein WBO49_03535 [Candidatus Saccharimonas sp.]
MMLLGSTLLNTAVMSIQTGGELARTTTPIIDSANLKVLAYELEGPLLESNATTLIRLADVRELSDIGLIVDSSDEFVRPEDVIALNEVYSRHFRLIGMNVTDERRQKLGKVVDFTVETGSYFIQQLTVRRPLLKSLNDTELLVHRSQIIEINDRAIVVHSEAKVPEPELHEVIGSYVNPFRKPESTIESSQRD